MQGPAIQALRPRCARAWRPTALAAVTCLTLGQASAQTWLPPAVGDWLVPSNWSTGAVPVAGGNVLVSNGGTATITGLAQTPLLGSLSVGIGGLGTGVGAVESTGTQMRMSGALSLGVASATAGPADGRLTIGGAGGTAGSLTAGLATSNAVGVSASGVLSADQAFLLSSSLISGVTSSTARGAVADGRVRIGGDAGTTTFVNVGTTFAIAPDQVGTRAAGGVEIGGNLALNGASVFTGTTGGLDRVADPAAPGGAWRDEGRGAVTVGGTLSVTGPASWFIGTTGGGVAEGSFMANVLDLGADALTSLGLGSAGAGGQAKGVLQAGSGDLRLQSGLNVGTTSGGSADGALRLLGGQLLGNGGLGVGVVSTGSATQMAQAVGEVQASGGVGGFTFHQVGVVFGAQGSGTSAQGRVIGGSAAPASTTGGVIVGLASNTAGAAVTARGELDLGTSLLLNNAPLQSGQTFDVGRGSLAEGRVRIGGHAGTSNFVDVGTTFTTQPDRVGSTARGVVDIGGNLALNGASVFIGTTGSVDRVADPAAPGGAWRDEAHGAVTVGGTLSVTGPASWFIGTTGGGVAEGSFMASVLDLGAGGLTSLGLGFAGGGGQAKGVLQADSGDLRLQSGLNVGTTSGGSADGALRLLGGQLLGNGGLGVGVVSTGSATQMAQAVGEVQASGGVGGFTFHQVGVVFGAQGSGTSAQGRVIGGSAAPASTTGGVIVGLASNTAGAAVTARGELDLGTSLLLNNAPLQSGQTFDVGRGSLAEGRVRIGGHAGTSNFVDVGTTFTTQPDRVGSTARGVVDIGGNLALNGASVFIGTTGSVDRVADPAAPGGAWRDEAHGAVTVGGTLSVTGPASWFIGATGGGVAEGSLRAGSLSMSTALDSLLVGNAGAGGTARGDLVVDGGTLRANTVNLGHAAGGGDATGVLALNDTQMLAQRVQAGIGGEAQLMLTRSQATIADDLTLLRGLLGLDRSFIDVGDALVLGADALTRVAIDGLSRGSEYAAMDSAVAQLAGLLEVDFSDLVFNGASAVFDILRSRAADGIAGDFAGLSFINVPLGYLVSAGLELDGVEVFRVRLTREQAEVPEPTTAAVVALGLALLASGRRRRRPDQMISK